MVLQCRVNSQKTLRMGGINWRHQLVARVNGSCRDAFRSKRPVFKVDPL